MTVQNPHPMGEEKRHYWLAKRMATCTGADLQAALDAGEIDHADWAAVVTRCRGCNWVEGCEAWMAEQERGAADVPQACPNAAVFETVLAAQADGSD